MCPSGICAPTLNVTPGPHPLKLVASDGSWIGEGGGTSNQAAWKLTSYSRFVVSCLRVAENASVANVDSGGKHVEPEV